MAGRWSPISTIASPWPFSCWAWPRATAWPSTTVADRHQFSRLRPADGRPRGPDRGGVTDPAGHRHRRARRRPARARWPAGWPSISACPTSTPGCSIARWAEIGKTGRRRSKSPPASIHPTWPIRTCDRRGGTGRLEGRSDPGGSGQPAGFPAKIRPARRPVPCSTGGCGDGHLPRASVKLFVTASAEARAERRYRSCAQGGRHYKAARSCRDGGADRRDSERAAAPLKAAPDAYHLDTSDMDADAAFAAALAFMESKGFRSSGP